MRKMKTMDGNTAAAHIAYAFTDVAAIYPITPSSPMAEHVDEWVAQGRKNIFGQTVKVMEMQSEAGAAGAVHGSLQAGALTTTFTASQGLLLMIPNMYKIAGELLPGVFHVSARALAANSLNIFGDHQDVMAARQTGFAMLAEGSVQEVMDLSAVAHLTAIKSRIPFVNFFDGFRTSHEIQKIEVLEYDELAKLLDTEAVEAFRRRALNPDHPVTRGTAQNPDVYFQEREVVNKFYDAVPEMVEGYMAEMTKLTGREYHCFDYYGAPDADRIIVAMGSVTDLVEETIDYLNANGNKVGLVKVRLFRPFSVERMLKVIPSTVKKIAVLDRTKEPGSAAEPLFLEVKNAFYGKENAPVIVGGRYGLGSKDTVPAHIVAVYENLAKNEPKDGFTVAIVDDVTNTSLDAVSNDIDTTPEGTKACKFWGLGSDGTVGANKSAIKIIGDHTDMYAQGYFAYDSKKSGGITVSHLRFGKKAIKSPYLINKADFVACHNQSYVYKYNVLDGLKKNGTFLLSTIWSPEELEEKLPASYKRYIATNNIKFYTLNAVKIAQEIGLGGRINMIMQSAFFKLADIIPVEDAIKYLKDAVVSSYGKKGQNVVDMNNAAIDKGVDSIVAIEVPASWANAVDAEVADAKVKPEFVTKIVEPMNRQEGDSLPVSAFLGGMEDGTFENGTAAYEKRGIAINVPEWQADKCIQCNQCSYVCPHAVIRPFLLSETEKNNAPEGMKIVPAKALKTAEPMSFTMAISPLDCSGCGNCAQVCPAPEKALIMKPQESQHVEIPTWEYATEKVAPKANPMNKNTLKGSQFEQPLLEFSGACAGCGETPYAKLVTQLFGDRMMVANATGCSSIWGGSAPSTPYTKNHNGHGPAWANSLFEDNAEFGMGMYLGVAAIRERLAVTVKSALEADLSETTKAALADWLENMNNGEATRDRANNVIAALETETAEIAKEILKEKDFLVKRSQWIFGGDGWAYDIGFGGLDHVLASGEDINVLVFDTEVYSNTGGQSSKSTPAAAIAKFAASGKRTKKKDLGMMAMSYGYVYVAQISMGADKNQTLKAIAEAEAYPGPSLIIAYAPCINHGLKAGMGNSQLEAKKAVESGYWAMYRFNPALKEQGKKAFSLDSKEPTADFKSFLMGEVRYASLAKAFPEAADALFEKTYQDAMERLENYKRLATQE
ncbi:pyruvate:ferredoxin (flavodoxin) oxidoreductase [Clostridium manihotivorum]|uniref:Pyruvate:ferredoxin oxidoreductase n=1 Tax=Clostridium manihotivorum TaxID=2320868 RepID=A0A3R5QYK7_9CLOT|nr:pyruvate:ferredoxin (flavodoxin) oxidoreductase [Clostridium manihotivorum]QAA35247.1 pyruvate:ferredoxin (flavodoxin) oxidoreductase [Clostridium manihotivorum]